jgi:hypothetical protein
MVLVVWKSTVDITMHNHSATFSRTTGLSLCLPLLADVFSLEKICINKLETRDMGLLIF